MATRKSPPPPTQANLTVDQMRRGINRLERVIAEVEEFDVSLITKRWGPEQKALETTIEGVLTSVFGHDTVEYRRYSGAASLDNGGLSMFFGPGVSYHDEAGEARRNVTDGKTSSIQILKTAVKWLHEEIGDAAEAEPTAESNKVVTTSQKIFIVHGHDDAALQTVARFVERIEYEAVILSEQANQGRTIIEKIEANRDVGFAIILMTPDDIGGKAGTSLRPRVRQNVLLELGYFMAHLGRERVCALAKGDIEIPTDFAGIVWEALDDGGAWKQKLARELSAAGYGVDWNKVMK